MVEGSPTHGPLFHNVSSNDNTGIHLGAQTLSDMLGHYSVLPPHPISGNAWHARSMVKKGKVSRGRKLGFFRQNPRRSPEHGRMTESEFYDWYEIEEGVPQIFRT